jgi:hypothetical protein
LSRRDKKRVYVGLALVIVVIFCAGIIAGFVSRNDTICGDGKPPLKQRPDVALGHTVYLCQNGQTVTK